MKTKQFLTLVPGIICIIIILSGCKHGVDYYSRGVGIYPGNPAEDFSPYLVSDTNNYRNLAKLRTAYHSTAYDYNLTAQLITDGIIINEKPNYISVSTSQDVLKKNEREWLFDGKSDSKYRISGTDIWLQLEINQNAPEVSRLELVGSVTYDSPKTRAWPFICYG